MTRRRFAAVALLVAVAAIAGVWAAWGGEPTVVDREDAAIRARAVHHGSPVGEDRGATIVLAGLSTAGDEPVEIESVELDRVDDGFAELRLAGYWPHEQGNAIGGDTTFDPYPEEELQEVEGAVIEPDGRGSDRHLLFVYLSARLAEGVERAEVDGLTVRYRAGRRHHEVLLDNSAEFFEPGE